ncbi:MAG: hypothetical protein L0Y74_08120 [candidate division Zixibacteria bacterium]|nr:hypothetical protein [candidate division Zixibacteria bacterium]
MPKVRDKVFEQVKTSLLAIKTASGYNTDVKTVSRTLQTLEQMNDIDLPALFVVDAGAEAVENDSNPQQIFHRLLIIIQGYFRDRSAQFSNNFNGLIADICKVIYAPMTFEEGGQRYADNLILRAIQVTGQDTEPQQLTFNVQIEVTYQFSNTAP